MSKYNQILILYHIKEREYVICKMMERCILDAKIASEVLVLNMHETYHSIYKYNPDVIVSPLPREPYSCALVNLIKYTISCLWVVIPTEGFMPATREEMTTLIGTHEYSRSLIDYYLFWGPLLRDAALDYLLVTDRIINSSRMKIFGYLPYDKQANKFYESSNYLDKIHKKIDEFKRSFLFVTGFTGAFATQDEYIEQGYILASDTEEEKDRKLKGIEVEYNFREKYVDIIMRLSEKYPEYLFVVKLHPIEVNKLSTRKDKMSCYFEMEKRDNILLITEAIQLGCFIDKVECLIHYGSTTGIEAYVHSKPTIQIVDCDNREYFNNVLSTAEVNIDDYDKIEKLIGSGIDYVRLDKTEEYLKGYMNYSDDYHPSIIFTELFAEFDKVTCLSKKDETVRLYLKGRVCTHIRLHFWKKLVMAFFCFDLKKALLIFKWLLKYYSNYYLKLQ